MEPSIRTIISEGKSDQATGRQRQKLLSLFHQPDIEFELKGILYEDLNQMEVFPEDMQYYEGVFEKIWEKRKRDLSVWKNYKQFPVPYCPGGFYPGYWFGCGLSPRLG